MVLLDVMACSGMLFFSRDFIARRLFMKKKVALGNNGDGLLQFQ